MTNRRQFNTLGLLVLVSAAPLLASPAASAKSKSELEPEHGIGAGSGKLLDRSKVEIWLSAYRAAWEGRDSDKAVQLFTSDAHYRDSAFEPTMIGRDAIHKYWSKSVSNQRDIKFQSTLWSVSDKTAIAHWAAEFVAIDTQQRVRLDGVVHLTFSHQPSGSLICSEFLEWWFAA